LRGKKILKRFFDEYIQSLGFGYHIFSVDLAKIAAKNSELIKELCEIIKKMNETEKKKSIFN